MNKMIKKAAFLAAAGIMTAGMLTGCGEKSEALDGSKTVATVNGTDISVGMVSLSARIQQAQTAALYKAYMGSDDGIWDMVADEESGETMGTQAVRDCLEQIELMYIMKEKAVDYGIEVTEEEQAKIAEAAAAFIEENEEAAIAEIAVSEEQVKEYLELQVYGDRMYNAVLEETELTVTDEEAQQSSFTYVSLSKTGEELTEEDIEKLKEQAQEILDQMQEDPTADMDEIAKGVDESLSAFTGSFSTNTSEESEDSYAAYPEEVLEVLRGLGEGEIAEELIETEDSIYVVRLDLINDEEATAEEKASLESTQKSEHYTEVSEQWKEEAEITVDEKILSTITITDSHKFSIKEEIAEEEIAEEVPEEEAVEEEVSEEETEE